MSDFHPRESQLRGLVQDARAEALAELDWNELEERLMKSVAQPPTLHSRRSRSLLPFGAGALALAAAATLWLANEPSPNLASPTPSVAVAPTSLHQNGDELVLGQGLSAGEHELTVEHAGRASWTLAAGSRAALASRGDVITVRLDAGSVLSRVVKSPKPESFVVEAAGARIAVHGTVFRVRLEGGRVLVEVHEGSVAVGAQGEAPAFFLRPPAKASFALDGRSGNVAGAVSVLADPHRTAPPRPSLPRMLGSAAEPSTGPAAPTPSAELSDEPSINDIEAGVTRIEAAASSCFKQHTQLADGVQLTVRTAISVTIAPSGTVSGVEIQPPLSPEAGACAAASIAQVTFAPSRRGTSVTRLLELKR